MFRNNWQAFLTVFPFQGLNEFLAVQSQTRKWSKPRANLTQAISPIEALGKGVV